MQHISSIKPTGLVVATLVVVVSIVHLPSHRGARQTGFSKAAAPNVVAIAIRDYKFEPATVTVHTGDTVAWKNYDSVAHTATENGAAQKTAAFDSGNIDPGVTWQYVAQKQGTYSYICTIHPNMKGELIVQ